MSLSYEPETITRAQADALGGGVVLQFGTDWCGFCRASERAIEPTLGRRDDLVRIAVEDGPGRPLGRSYRVKLWPTLVFLANGVEVARLVRPQKPEQVTEALATLDAALA